MQEPPGERKPWLALLPAPRSPPGLHPPRPVPRPPPRAGVHPPRAAPSIHPAGAGSQRCSVPSPSRGDPSSAPRPGPAPSSPLPRPRPAHPAAPRPSRTAPRAAAPARPWLHPRAPPPRPARTPGSPPRGAGRGGGQPGFLSGGVGAGCLDLLGEGTQTPGCPGGGGSRAPGRGGRGGEGTPGFSGDRWALACSGRGGAGRAGTATSATSRRGTETGPARAGPRSSPGPGARAGGRHARAGHREFHSPSLGRRTGASGLRHRPPTPPSRASAYSVNAPPAGAPRSRPPPRGLVPFVPRRRAQHWGGGGRESGGPGSSATCPWPRGATPCSSCPWAAPWAAGTRCGASCGCGGCRGWSGSETRCCRDSNSRSGFAPGASATCRLPSAAAATPSAQARTIWETPAPTTAASCWPRSRRAAPPHAPTRTRPGTPLSHCGRGWSFSSKRCRCCESRTACSSRWLLLLGGRPRDGCPPKGPAPGGRPLLSRLQEASAKSERIARLEREKALLVQLLRETQGGRSTAHRAPMFL
ncbi:suppressor APC domain-containing protein 1 isoform X2 [Alligator mississippiensis]|uniref:suppressor APC domain-containing protein 1 isoform X2 n=1 Tax=Alligator mississippiensis TaxID=8496 RepID=UPI002877690D|nr:suppressor APC domain-containing protein 1 isoform X2 [Alligator mississippiensis]